MALSLAIFFAGLAAATAQPAARQPSGAWKVEFDDAQCVASRPYGSADKPLYLVLKAPPIGEVIQIAVMRQGGSAAAEQVDATIRADEQRPLKTTMLMFKPKGRQVRVYLLNMPSTDFAQIGTAKNLTIKSTGLNETFSLSQIAPLMKIMGECVADLRKVWNVTDPAGEQSPLAARAEGSFLKVITPDDYPDAAVSRNQSGTARFVAMIDEQGQIADCTIIATSGVAVLDTQTCAIVEARAKFKPARGQDGKPAKDAAMQSVTWRLE